MESFENYLFLLYGSIQEKMPLRYFFCHKIKQNVFLWVYREKFTFQILNFHDLSIQTTFFSV